MEYDDLEEAHYYGTISDFAWLMEHYGFEQVMDDMLNRLRLGRSVPDDFEEAKSVLLLLDELKYDVLNVIFERVCEL